MFHLKYLTILFVVLTSYKCSRNNYGCGVYSEFVQSKSEVLVFRTFSHSDINLVNIKGQVMGKFISRTSNSIDTLQFAALLFSRTDLLFHNQAFTDSKGFFDHYIPAGKYTISCSYTGMNSLVITNTFVKQGDIKELTFLLGVGNSQDSIDCRSFQN